MQDSTPSTSRLEHLNLTVSDVPRSAKLLCEIFDWKIRWEGASIHGGYTAHVGNQGSYLALYSHPHVGEHAQAKYVSPGSLNHVAILVEDLDAVEHKVLAAGLKTFNHGDYEPGRRFYFKDHDGTEFEVVSYAVAESIAGRRAPQGVDENSWIRYAKDVSTEGPA